MAEAELGRENKGLHRGPPRVSQGKHLQRAVARGESPPPKRSPGLRASERVSSSVSVVSAEQWAWVWTGSVTPCVTLSGPPFPHQKGRRPPRAAPPPTPAFPPRASPAAGPWLCPIIFRPRSRVPAAAALQNPHPVLSHPTPGAPQPACPCSCSKVIPSPVPPAPAPSPILPIIRNPASHPSAPSPGSGCP